MTQSKTLEKNVKKEKKPQKANKTQKKPYVSAWNNSIWSYKGMLKYAPWSFVLMVLTVPLNVFLNYAGIYLPSLVVAEVTGGETLILAACSVGGLILAMFLVSTLQQYAGHVSDALCDVYRFQVTNELSKKTLSCFFQNYEKKEIRDLCSRATRATEMWNGVQPMTDMPKVSLRLVENIINYCLFGTIISFVSPLLVPILTMAPAVNWICAKAYRNWEYKNRENWTDVDRKLWYVQSKPSNFTAAKDIRIYGMAGWFREVYHTLCDEREVWDKKLVVRSFLSRIADLIVILLRDGAAYALLIKMTLDGEIAVDKFVLYFSAISTFASFVGSIMNGWNKIHSTSLALCDFREYMDMDEQDGTGEASVEDHLNAAPEITFEHVSFRYDGAESDTLKDINFTIKAGEKVALVGLNGAGKTTLVKLLCGLYLPTSGDIKINGVSVRKFYRADYYKLFAPVFQDIKTAFFSLAETVSGKIGEGTDFERAENCMRLAGLGDKLDSLPKGIYTKLDKQVNADGVELSGGEMQKLMLARALYKDAPVLVLDEPTAALDPIAEHQIYMQYQKMTENKSSLFISHRLASTQFCDRILYLKEGKVAEEGTHSELVGAGGEYSELFEMQSCWYREDYKGGEQA